MIDYEKKYKDALGMAEEIIRYYKEHNRGNETSIEDLEQIFPELAESGDERIREEILGFLKTNNAWNKEWIAWLKKQGDNNNQNWKPSKEQFEALDYAYNSCSDTERGNYYEGVLETLIVDLHRLEKQGEQKPISDTTYVVKAGDSLSVNGQPFDYEKATITQNDFASVGETATIELSSPIDCGDRIYHVSHKPIEKQGEQKVSVADFKAKDWYVSKVDGKIRNIYYSVDKVEPKFKVGDFIINDYCMGRVIEITNDAYLLDTEQGIPFSCPNTRLWNITKDAKDGDVLASDNSIFIFQEEYIAEKPVAYCGLMNGLFVKGEDACWTNEKCHPATKEQCELLFQKMKEAGYEWDAEKKKLKKIKQEFTESPKDYHDIDPHFGITEDYCSYELSQLLKEKGFEGVCEYAYSNKGNYFEIDRSNFDEVYCLRPTHQMAMKWLREVHKVLIVIDAYHADHWEGYIDSFEISIYHYASTIIVPNEIAHHTDYEKAVEAALKYTLEKLI